MLHTREEREQCSGCRLRRRSVYPKSDPLPLAEEYWCLRDAIVHCELLMLRVLQFRVSVDHPHRVSARGPPETWHRILPRVATLGKLYRNIKLKLNL